MINVEETIFALSTVFGKSGVAVIRVSGNNALKTLGHFKVRKKVKPRFATLVSLYDKYDKLIENGIVIYFPSPCSFTGEDIIELQVHGSRAVIKILLKELSKIFVMARPGEFSLRAFLNGKFDLITMEGIADLIDAETEVQAKQAIKQISGVSQKLYSNWRQSLISIRSQIEAYIDFPEEILEEKDQLKKINSEIQNLKQLMQKHLDDNQVGERLREGLRVVITGKPNVGKSTLFNFLAKSDIAIVSEYAGTTRDVIDAHIDIFGYPIVLSDTAGICESLDPIELEGIVRAKKRSCEADLRIELFPFEEYQNIDSNILDNNTIYVLSKADNVVSDENMMIGKINFLPVSVLKGIGTSKLLSLIKERIEEKFAHGIDTPVITRQRHRNHLQKALKYLEYFNINNPIELISEDIRLASVELSALIGIINVEEILDSIFSSFCIGK